MEGSTNAAGLRRPGQYADERYRRGMRSFRRRFYRQVGWALALVTVAELLLTLYVDSTVAWMAFAFVLGGTIATVWILRELPPEHVRRWGAGAWGEQQTAKVLEPLEHAGWTVEHDLARERGNIDHLVESPGGRRFLLETKTLQGRLVVEAGCLTSTQPDDEEQIFRNRRLRHVVLERARSIYKERPKGWVQAVVVIWGDFPQRCVEDGKLVFVHGDDLAGWLRQSAA